MKLKKSMLLPVPTEHRCNGPDRSHKPYAEDSEEGTVNGQWFRR